MGNMIIEERGEMASQTWPNQARQTRVSVKMELLLQVSGERTETNRQPYEVAISEISWNKGTYVNNCDLYSYSAIVSEKWVPGKEENIFNNLSKNGNAIYPQGLEIPGNLRYW